MRRTAAQFRMDGWLEVEVNKEGERTNKNDLFFFNITFF